MNDMKKIEAVEEALDRLYEKLDELNAKSGQMSDSCAELYKILLHGIKCGETVTKMKESGEEYSERDMSRDGGSYDGSGDGGSYRRKRNSMGRFSREGSYEGGYSRHETGGLKRKLEELKEESPEVYEKLLRQLDM